MAVTAADIERRRRLAQEAAQAVDPTEIEGLAPPPTPSVLAAQAPRMVTDGQLEPPPVQTPARPTGTAAQALQTMRARGDPADALREIRQREADRAAGRLETAASEFGEGFAGVLKSLPEGAIRGVVAERQGQGLASKLGLQPLANAVLGRELTEDELTRVLPEIENNAATQAIDKALDFGLGSNPNFLGKPPEEGDFELQAFLNGTVPNALGSAGGFLTAALIAKVAGAGTIGGAAVASVLGSLATGVEQAKDVESKGGTNEQIIDAYVAGNVPGLLEGLPLARALNRLDRGSGGHMSRVIKEGFKGSTEELIQEAVQAASMNAITNAILDLKDPILDRSVAEGGAAGAVAGFIQSALLTAIGGRRGGGPRRRKKGPAGRAKDAADGKAPGGGQRDATQEALDAEDISPADEGDQNAAELFGEEEAQDDADFDTLADQDQPAQTPPEPAGELQPAPAPPIPPVAPTPAPPTTAPVEPTTGEVPAVMRPAAPAGTQEGGTNTVITPAGNTVETQFGVADLDALITSDNAAFPVALQPRDRGDRQALDQQINDIIARFDPRFLGVQPSAGDGAPMVNSRGEVLSGNGRLEVLRRIRTSRPELWEQYQTYVREELGVELGENEVLVQAITTPQTAEQQRAFVTEANVSERSELSPGEQARVDADTLTDDALALFVPGTELTTTQNAAFVQKFVADARARGETGNAIVTKDGRISAQGVRRIQGALLAKALGASETQVDALTRALESTDNNTRNITNAIIDNAGALAGLNSAVEAGQLRPDFRVAEALTNAIEQTSAMRAEGRSVEEALGQSDLLNPRDPLTDQFIRVFNKSDFSRPETKANVTAILREFAANSLNQGSATQGDLVGGDISAVDVLQTAREAVQGRDDTGPQPGADLFTGGQNGQQPTPATPTPDAAPVAPAEQQPGPGNQPAAAPAAAAAAAGATAAQPATAATEDISPQPAEPASPATEGQGTRVITSFDEAVAAFEDILGRGINADSTPSARARFDEIMAAEGQAGATGTRADIAAVEALADNELITDDELATLTDEVLGDVIQPAAEGETPGPNDITDFESAERVFGEILGREITGTGAAVQLASRKFDEIMAEEGIAVRPDVAALEAMQDAELLTPPEVITLTKLLGPAVTPQPAAPTQEAGKGIPPDPVQPVGDQMDTANQTQQSYPETETATEAARRLGNSILEDYAKEAEKNASLPQNHPDINTFALSFNKDLIQQNVSLLIGKVMNTVRDIAAAVQAYRDPRFETLRYFFLDANNKIIFQTAVSSRMPASSKMFPTGQPEWLAELSEAMSAAGATKLWVSHNHPQAASTPSPADISATKWLKDTVFPGLTVQHVIVNHNEYSHINSVGMVRTNIQDDSLNSIDFSTPREDLNHELLGEELFSSGALFQLQQRIIQPGKISIVGTADGKITALADFDASLLTFNLKNLRDQIDNWRSSTGADHIYLAGLPPGSFPLGRTGSGKDGLLLAKDMDASLNTVMKALVRNGLIQDFVDVDGNSAIQNNIIRPRKGRPPNNPLDLDTVQVQKGSPTIESDADGLNTHATRRQKEINEEVKKGQPIERLFRWMWTGFGVFEDRMLVTNEQGQDPQWALGVKAWEGFTDFIVNKKFEETNPSASWFNKIMLKARRGLLDRHGVPDSAKSINEQRRTFQIQLVQQAGEFVTRLEEAGVDSAEEGALVQRFLVGEASEEEISDKEWLDVAVEVRAAVDALGMQAVMLGLISRESYERNKGTWLHRTYFSNEGYFVTDNNAINKWMGQNIKGKAQVIGGEIEKGRGLFLEHPQSRILRDVPPAFRDRFTTRTDGKPDKSLLDQRFRIIDLIDQGLGDQQNIPGVAEGGRGVKVKRRLFLPADEEVAIDLGPYEDRGEFVVRRIRNNGDLVLWRDYSVAEREHMGEIVDARYNIVRSFQLLGRDLANGNFFLQLASNPEWVWDTTIGGPTPPLEVIAESADRLKGYIDAEWVLVPDATIGKTANVKRWGALAGKYIKVEIWNDINQMAEMRTPGKWDSILTTWKLNKTALNPVVHMNNVVSNLILMDMIDVRLSDLVEGTMMRLAPAILANPKLSHMHSFARKYQNDDLLNKMRAYGAFGHSMVDIDLSNELLTGAVAELQRMIDGGKGVENTFVAKGKMMWTISKLWTQFGNALDAQKNLYRLEDEVFRAATVLRKLEQGYSMQDAAVMAREQFLNYDIRAPWINNMRRSVFPFISYTYRAVPALAEAIARRPWKLAKYITMAEIANSLAYAISDGEEEYERGSLRTQAQGVLSFGLFNTGWLPGGGIPRMMRLPTNDEFGRPQFLDVRRWVPAGDVFDLHSANPMPVPTWLQFSGPLMVAAELYMNKSAFTGQQIVDPLSDDWADKTKKYGSFAYQAIMPSAPWIPESWYWNRIKETAQGTTDPVGRTNSTTQATLQAFGLKVSSQDPELGYSYKAVEFDNTARAYSARLNNAARRLSRGHMTQTDFDAEQKKVARKLKQLADNRAEAFQPFLNRRGPDANPINME